MAITVSSKAPGERIAYLWTPSLVSGDTIAGVPSITLVSGTAATDGVTVVAGLQVKIWLISGVDNETSEFLCEVNTVSGETLQETIYLPVNSTDLSAIGAKLVQIFPAFAVVPAATMDYWIDQAAITANWGDAHAHMLLAAHMMSINGLGKSASMNGLTNIKSGAVDMTFSNERANATGYQQTPYGQQFEILLRRQFGGPRLIQGDAGETC